MPTWGHGWTSAFYRPGRSATGRNTGTQVVSIVLLLARHGDAQLAEHSFLRSLHAFAIVPGVAPGQVCVAGIPGSVSAGLDACLAVTGRRMVEASIAGGDGSGATPDRAAGLTDLLVKRNR
jgi:hypothetical protein